MLPFPSCPVNHALWLLRSQPLPEWLQHRHRLRLPKKQSLGRRQQLRFVLGVVQPTDSSLGANARTGSVL
jgi:hypothetical protein